MTDFVKRIDEELEYQGLKKSDIINSLGIADSTVRSWWKKDSMPSADVALRVAKFLGVSLEYLITGKDSPQVHKMPPPLDDREKELLEDFRKLNETDKIESIAIIKLKLNLYQTLSATNGKSVTIKDC